MSEFLGILREGRYSPGKVGDDRGILQAVAARLRAAHHVRVVSAEDELCEPKPATVVFAMCQGPRALEALRRWETVGIRVINSAQAVENCHRARTMTLLARHAVPHPESVIVFTECEPAWPAWIATGAWVKRGDVHAMRPDDVVRLHDAATATAACATFFRRDIRTALLQRHVDGEVSKFYAVRDEFFVAYPEGGDQIISDGGHVAAIRTVAQAAADALGLEVYGGDCVCDPRGRVWLIDINDWPSFGRCRERAAAAIARYLERAAAGRSRGPGRSRSLPP